jgi:hypothetical protein
MEELPEIIIIIIFYVIWPVLLIIGIYISIKRKKEACLVLLSKAILAWLTMSALNVYLIYCDHTHYMFWGTILFAIFIITLRYSLLGGVSVWAQNTN